MILTLTPNPSFDRTVALDGELARGQVHRVASVTSQAGGKGVNISRAAVSADIPSIAVVPALKDDPSCSSCSAPASTAARCGPRATYAST